VVRKLDTVVDTGGFDMVIAGPGPGDPRDLTNPKMAALHEVLRRLLSARQPFLAICLSHQILSGHLGLELRRKPMPAQGLQSSVDFLGRRRTLGFYNTFSATCHRDSIAGPAGAFAIEVGRDLETTEVHSLRGPHFWSVQFHPESILSRDGMDVLVGMLASLLRPASHRTPLPVEARQ